LHGHQTRIPGIGELAVQELEPAGGLDVGQLQVGHVRQDEKRSPATGRLGGVAEEVDA
jgi:hypothetical protein